MAQKIRKQVMSRIQQNRQFLRDPARASSEFVSCQSEQISSLVWNERHFALGVHLSQGANETT
jgi:hypothetical protein